MHKLCHYGQNILQKIVEKEPWCNLTYFKTKADPIQVKVYDWSTAIILQQQYCILSERTFNGARLFVISPWRCMTVVAFGLTMKSLVWRLVKGCWRRPGPPRISTRISERKKLLLKKASSGLWGGREEKHRRFYVRMLEREDVREGCPCHAAEQETKSSRKIESHTILATYSTSTYVPPSGLPSPSRWMW